MTRIGDLRFEYIDPSQVKDNEKNWRKHPQRQLDGLNSVYDKVGDAGAAVINERDEAHGWTPEQCGLYFCDGHARKKLKIKRGEPLPAVIGHWTPEQERTIIGTHDIITELAEVDVDILRQLTDSDELTKALAKEDARLREVLQGEAKPEPKDAGELIDKAAELQAKWNVARGDVWQVGKHRVMCGDSTNAADVATLMQGERARLVFTDPPYNVDYGSASSVNDSRRRAGRSPARAGIENDCLSSEEWEQFQQQWMAQVFVVLDGAVYICMSAKEWASTRLAFAVAGGHWSSDIIWVKDRLVLGRKNYHSRYEAMLYGWIEGKEHFWCGARDRDDVWEIKRNSVNELHPTQKPPELVQMALNDSCPANGIVLDPFLGSGTTLVACEQTGRIGRGMEIEPKYVAVTLERLSGLGLTPQRLASDE